MQQKLRRIDRKETDDFWFSCRKMFGFFLFVIQYDFTFSRGWKGGSNDFQWSLRSFSPWASMMIEGSQQFEGGSHQPVPKRFDLYRWFGEPKQSKTESLMDDFDWFIMFWVLSRPFLLVEYKIKTEFKENLIDVRESKTFQISCEVF